MNLAGIRIFKTPLNDILHLREMYLKETSFQVRYDSCHFRNWSDSYLIKDDGVDIGYGSIKGLNDLSLRDTIFEFYLIKKYRNKADILFSKLISECEARFIECQTNDLILPHLTYEFAENISSDTILFDDQSTTTHHFENTGLRKRQAEDEIFEGTGSPEDAGEYVLEKDGKLVASGGFLLHYNFPFADLYMEVKKEHRHRGLGAFVLQEIKKVCYASGRTPAARCSIKNKASKAALIKAGMGICGYMLKGEIKKS